MGRLRRETQMSQQNVNQKKKNLSEHAEADMSALSHRLVRQELGSPFIIHLITMIFTA